MSCPFTDILSDKRKLVNLFHILAVAPLLGYIGYNGMEHRPIDDRIYQILIGVAILVLVYHSYRLMGPSEEPMLNNREDEFEE